MNDEMSSTDAAVTALLVQARALLQQNDMVGATTLLEQAIDLDPENVDTLIARGAIRRAAGQWERAVLDFSQALTLRHDSHEGYFERAQTYAAWLRADPEHAPESEHPSERIQFALRDYSTAFRIQPDPAYLLARAGVRELAQQWNDARADYDRVLAVCREGDAHHQAALEGKQELAAQAGATRAAQVARQDPLDASSTTMLEQARQVASRAHAAAVTDPPPRAPHESIDADCHSAMAIAREIVDQFLHDSPIEYAITTVHSFNDVDRKWYEKASDELISLGFQPLGDFEPLHLTRSLGKRLLVRLLADSRRRTLAALCQRARPQFAAVKSWPARLLKTSSRSSQIELETEMADGKFIVTTNTRGLDALAFPPQLDVVRMQGKTALSDLCSVHSERVREYKTAHSPMVEVCMRNTRQAFELQERRRALTVKFCVGGGGLSGIELKSLLGSRYAALGAQVRTEVAHLLAETRDQVPLA